MNNLKFSDRILLSAPHMSGSEEKYIKQAFIENWIVPLGPNVNAFESEMVTFLETNNLYAVAMSSGTAAIHIALRLLDVKQDEEIFCSSLTFAATANPILYEKAKPIFIDSDFETWNICPKSLQKAIDEKVKNNQAIPRILIAVDLFGMSANYNEIIKICEKNNIILIEDAAEALGSSFNKKKCGTFGKFGILSFNGNKIITTSGGGMLITHSKEEAEKALFLITQARDPAPYYLHSHLGFNYRMSNICAGIGRGQLEVINDRVESRRSHFKTYQNIFVQHLPEFKLQEDPNGHYSNHWLTVGHFINKKIDIGNILKLLNEYNIEARHVWKPLHTQPIFKEYKFYSIEKESVSEQLFNNGICLPSSSSLNSAQVEKIANLFIECVKKS